MKCPFCFNDDTKVIDTRSIEENTSIRRKRLCEKCNEKFITHEKIDIIPVYVIKNNMIRERFDRDKLFKGIILACNKRPIPTHDIEVIVKDIENKIFSISKKEIRSKDIGEMVMNKLKKLDDIAYVRFASVYREFKDLGSFISEVTRILQEKK